VGDQEVRLLDEEQKDNEPMEVTVFVLKLETLSRSFLK
jgi:hypothetical protein